MSKESGYEKIEMPGCAPPVYATPSNSTIKGMTGMRDLYLRHKQVTEAIGNTQLSFPSFPHVSL